MWRVNGWKIHAAWNTHAQPVVLETASKDVIAGANAACRYLALLAGPSACPLVQDEWLEYEQHSVSPAVETVLEASGKTQFPLEDTSSVPAPVGAAYDAILSCVQQISDALAGSDADQVFGTAASPTLAAVVMGASLHPIIDRHLIRTDAQAVSFLRDLQRQAWFAEAVRVAEASSLDDAGAAGDSGGGAPEVAIARDAATSASVEAGPTDSVQQRLEDLFTDTVLRLFPGMDTLGFDRAVCPSNAHPGKFDWHYQCQAAQASFGRLKGAKMLPDGVRSPGDVAQLLVERLPETNLIDRVTTTKAGHIQIYLKPEYLNNRLQHIVKHGVEPPPVRPRRVAVDYSSPNIAKEMHIGHLRSTILGDALCRILEYCGHEVLRINHVGDWGTQFGMLIAYIKDTYPNFATERPVIHDLNTFYKSAKNRFDEEPEFKARSQQEVVALQRGDPTNLMIWQQMVDMSREMFEAVYERLGVDKRLELRGESYYNDMIPGIIQALEEKGITEVDDGATVVRIEGYEVPLMLQKRDGGVGYDSTDMAALYHRIHTLGCDWLVYVIDSGQAMHMQLVFEGSKLAGWADPKRHRLDHVGFGVIQGEDGKRFKSRSGESVRLVDVLDEARDRALRNIKEHAETSLIESEEEQFHVAEALGYGGVKYYDLRQNRLSDYVFNYDRMLAHDGDTAVYMQYAHARFNSILRKARARGVDVDGALRRAEVSVEHKSEIELARMLARWAEIVLIAEDTLMPHHICNYLYRLTQTFSSFHRDCRVLGDPQQDSRLCIVHAAREVLRCGMHLVGIDPVERI